MGRAQAIGGPGSGRKKGDNQGLYEGESEAIESLSKAIAIHGESHPIIAECTKDLLKIARGAEGYRGRYIGERMRAIVRLLDMLAGRPREAKQPERDDARGAIAKLIEDCKEPDE